MPFVVRRNDVGVQEFLLCSFLITCGSVLGHPALVNTENVLEASVGDLVRIENTLLLFRF